MGITSNNKTMLRSLLADIEKGRKPEFLFFWGHTENAPVTKACLSQWYDCAFKVNGMYYRTAVQYLMAEKACKL